MATIFNLTRYKFCNYEIYQLKAPSGGRGVKAPPNLLHDEGHCQRFDTALQVGALFVV